MNLFTPIWVLPQKLHFRWQNSCCWLAFKERQSSLYHKSSVRLRFLKGKIGKKRELKRRPNGKDLNNDFTNKSFFLLLKRHNFSFLTRTSMECQTFLTKLTQPSTPSSSLAQRVHNLRPQQMGKGTVNGSLFFHKHMYVKLNRVDHIDKKSNMNFLQTEHLKLIPNSKIFSESFQKCRLYQQLSKYVKLG